MKVVDNFTPGQPSDETRQITRNGDKQRQISWTMRM